MGPFLCHVGHPPFLLLSLLMMVFLCPTRHLTAIGYLMTG